ncbi:hypothetical protein OE165_27475, partial [Escherichia coli]|uniref:hypothetical protein n=1 Tax=Escherichia coli TaxID=562 RepID=UPI0021F2FC5D
LIMNNETEENFEDSQFQKNRVQNQNQKIMEDVIREMQASQVLRDPVTPTNLIKVGPIEQWKENKFSNYLFEFLIFFIPTLALTYCIT